jgi:hypothetical protein
MKALLDITPKSKAIALTTCGTMRKLRVHYREAQFSPMIHWDMKMTYSKHTWRQLLNMIGIDNDDDFKKYLDGRRNRKQVPSKVHT